MGNQNFSQKVVIKSFTKKDGTCPLYIYVSIDSVYDRIPLKLSWPKDFFDKDAGAILPRSKNDPDHSDFQLMIQSEVGKVNDIFKEYRLAKRTLTIELLLKDYYSFASRKDFLSFMKNDIKERRKRNKIEPNTRNGHMATLNKLEEFWTAEVASKTKKKPLANDVLPLPFSSVTPKLLENFRAFLRNKHGNVPSTVEKAIKDLRTYVKRALADKNIFDDPFKVIKVGKPESFPNVLTQEQLQDLLKLFEASNTPDAWQTVLRHFLFSCFTGLRISDAKAVNHEDIKNGWLVITQQKNRTNRPKIVRIPLHSMAEKLVETSLGKLFETFSEQYTNRLLDKISKAAEVDFKITTHTARHTFGTIFIELGGMW